MKIAIVTGASSGLGKAIAEALEHTGYSVINWSLDKGVDVTSAHSIKQALNLLDDFRCDVLINCAGVNSIDFLPDVTEETFDNVMSTNAKSIFLTAQALLEALRGGTILNIVSNAAHVPMTSSLAYNMSKAAALMATKQLARELKKTHDITVFSVSPNKLSGTGMSDYIEKRVCEIRGWTPEQAREYQLAALPAGQESSPVVIAELIAFLLASPDNHKYLNGIDLALGGPTQ